MIVELTSPSELNRRAFAALIKELGVIDALRYYSQHNLGGGDYTEERQALFADLTPESLRQAILERRQRNAAVPMPRSANGAG